MYNNKSGTSFSFDTLKGLFKKSNVSVRDVIAVNSRLKSNLAPHIAKGATIAVIGGDGTISAVAGMVANTKATLVPLPGGTLNHFAKDLGVADTLEKAIANIVKTNVKMIDIASVNGVYFVNNSSIGLYPTSLRVRDQLENKIGKWPAACVAVVRTVFRFHVYTLSINGKTVQTPFMFVGNNKYQLAARSAKNRTQLNAGELFVAVIRANSKWSAVKAMAAAVFGKVADQKDFILFTPQEVVVRAKRSHMTVSHDGEFTRVQTPLTYKIHHKALRVRC